MQNVYQTRYCINVKFVEFDHYTVIIKEYPCSRKYMLMYLGVTGYDIYNLFSKVSGKKKYPENDK